MKMLARLVVFAALAPAAYAQSVLYTFDGDSFFDVFGNAVSGAGDVNGDGVPDLIVGAIRDDNMGPQSGSARVFSGKDGSILYTFDGDSPFDFFGFSVSGAGDMNGDGFDDLIVGAPYADINGPDSGYARVYSGVNGSVLYTFNGNSRSDRLGYSVSGAGDVNGDGFADVIIGAPWDELNAAGIPGKKTKDTGLAYVYSGADGSVLHKLLGHSKKKIFGSTDDRFGLSVSGAGDVNGDGFDDVIVGSPGDDTNNGDDSGSARVFSGKNGKLLHLFKGDGVAYTLGYAVSGAGDVNGDGFADLIAGGLTLNIWEASKGIARVYSGTDGTVLYTFFGTPHSWLGYSVSGAGDVNGDGFDDLIVGSPLDKPNDLGSVRVISGKDGTTLQFHLGKADFDLFGVAVSGVGDVNGDGFADIMVGSMYEDSVNGQDSGVAYVFSGCDALGTQYCSPAVVNSTGVPAVITACGSPQVKANGGYFMLRAADLPANQFGYFLASETQGFVPNPGGSQGNLCLSGNIGRFSEQIQSSGPGGVFTIQVDLTSIPTSPPHTVLAGETWNFQAWYRDNNGGPTSNFTDAVSVLFK